MCFLFSKNSSFPELRSDTFLTSSSNKKGWSGLSVRIRLCVGGCLHLPLSRKTNNQQVVAFFPVAHMYQMCPEQERRTKDRLSEGAEQADGGVDINTIYSKVLHYRCVPT